MRRAMWALVAVVLLVGVFGAGYYLGSHADDRRVPDLLGLGTEDGGQAAARRELAAVELRLGQVRRKVCTPDESGLVVGQNPPADAVVPTGATVNILIGVDPSRVLYLGTPSPCIPGVQQPAGQPPSD